MIALFAHEHVRPESDTFGMFDLLASLVDKSLLIADPTGDSVRYHLLECTSGRYSVAVTFHVPSVR
jgi:predicted ATPase